MRVGILSQWYDPEPGPASLPGVLARGLRDLGHDVNVLTGFPNYPTGRLYDGYLLRRCTDEVVDGVPVRRVALYPNHGRRVLPRLLNYASFAGSALLSGLDALRGVDALWVYGSPATIAAPMWALQQRHGTPVVLHVMDLWPESILAAGFAARPAAQWTVNRLAMPWCDRMYRCADAVAYLSPGVATVLVERGVAPERLHYAPAWTDEQVFRPSQSDLRRELGIAADHVVLLYAGALGHAQGLETLLAACELVRSDRLTCLIAGDGVAGPGLRERAAQRGLARVRFLGPVAAGMMTELMATGDIHYVGLQPAPLSRLTMPSKIQATLACARPMIVAVDGDAALVAEQSGAAFVVAPGDPAALGAVIERACAAGPDELARRGAAGRAYYDQVFAARIGLARVEQLLVDCAAARSGSLAS